MHNKLTGSLSILLLCLSACGGGGSSSSGASNEPTSSPLSGTFTGMQTFVVTVTGAGITASDTVTATFRLDVNSVGNTATVVDDDFQAAGPITNGQFDVFANTPFSDGMLSCEGVINYTGSVAATDTNGDVTGTFVCTDTSIPGIGLTGDISGTFVGSKQNAKQELSPHGAFDAIADVLSKLEL